MTVYCPNTPTLVSTDGGDYIQYPPGTDVEVLPVTLKYNFIYSWNNFSIAAGPPGYIDCSKSFEWIWTKRKTGGIVDYSTFNPNTILKGANALLALAGDKWIIDNCFPDANISYVFQRNLSTPCGNYQIMSVRIDGAHVLEWDPRDWGTVSKTINAFRLKITTP